MPRFNNLLLPSETVLELVNNGSSVKLFTRVWKTIGSDDPSEKLMKKVKKFSLNIKAS